jgi:hypothetical protein
MLTTLRGYLVPPAGSLPPSTVSIVSLEERLLGLGNRRGYETIGSLATVALKGGRIDAVVRFQLWNGTLAAVDTLVDGLQASLAAARDTLWSEGFLKMTLRDTGLAERVSALGAWRKTTDYRVLYEYRFSDLDGAESLIARIPIHADQEERFSPMRETTLVCDEMVRWDDNGASDLVVRSNSRRPLRIAGMAILAWLPAGWSGNPVTLARIQTDNPAPPITYPTLADFLAAVTDPAAPDRHARVEFATLADLLAAFTVAGPTIPMGDWDEDGVPDGYVPGTLDFGNPVILDRGNQLFRVSYQDPAFDTPAVVYLRAGVRGG